MKTHRRGLLIGSIGSVPMLLTGQTKSGLGRRVPAGEDRFGEHRVIGVSTADFKVAAGDTRDGLFVMEHKHTRKGGPARHLHLKEDEWLYVLDGRYLVGVGSERQPVAQGDSVLIPRQTPHTFGFTGEGIGKLLVAFSPAGRMEECFRAFKDRKGAYSRWDSPEEQERARSFGMQLLGPPLSI